MHPYFQWRASKQRGGIRVLRRWAGSSEISLLILSLVRKTLNRHRTGFEPQRKSSFGETVKATPNTRSSRLSLHGDPNSLCGAFELLVVLASSAGGDEHFYVIVTL
jgi:hypothetical protein